MQLLDHISITVRDLQRVKPFYLAIMSALGAVVASERGDAISFGERNQPDNDGHTYLSVYQSPHASPDSRRHWCFRAASIEQVHAFHTAGVAAG